MKLLLRTLYVSLFLFLGLGLLSNTNAEEKKAEKQEDCPGGICTSVERLTNWTSKMDIYKALWMDHKNESWGEKKTSVMTFVQDIIYGATFFIGTVVTTALIVSGLLLVFSWTSTKLRNDAKNWFKYALIWLVIVTLSIVIVRAVQFIAQWWS